MPCAGLRTYQVLLPADPASEIDLSRPFSDQACANGGRLPAILRWELGQASTRSCGDKSVRPFVGLIAVVVAGCAAQPGPQRTEATHAANVAAAERAGYRVVTKDKRTLFCPTASVTGSHMAGVCMTETDFESLLGAPRSANSSTHVTNQMPGPGPGAGH
jgi:hypothetical protein